ncbi:MAG TPA: hypothetical protein VMT18_00775 [Planctomycetota bacterium]|nr:hypothetical protein [Planctomycetota bacterium]
MPLRELEVLIGREVHLDVLHGAVRRTCQGVAGVAEFGTCLVTCADEFQGELRRNFDRDVARPLLPHVPNRTFAVSNMAGRIEPGALQIADAHFTVKTRKQGSKLLLVEIAAHVGRRPGPDGPIYGELNRFGQPSPCCGALAMLLEPPAAAFSVRHPWFDQLSAVFGPERLAALQADASPHRLVSAAVVHAVLQAETGLADLLRDPPRTHTHVLLIACVVVNQRGSDGALLCGYHHLVSDGRHVQVDSGGSLRSTPGSHRFRSEGELLVLESPWEEDARVETALPRAADAQAVAAGREVLDRSSTPQVRERLAHTRRQVEHLERHPAGMRVYARPVLRGLLQALSVVAPEVGLAALLVESATDLSRARHLRELLARGPTSEEARRVLHDLEPTIAQLGHREAREVLETLLAMHPKGSR